MNQIEYTLTFVDLIILRELLTKKTVPIHVLHFNVNDFISRNEIPESHVLPISRYRLQQTLEKLRRFELIVPTGHYVLTPAGKKFISGFTNPWQGWPIYIPMINKVPHVEKAFYLREF